MRRPSLLYFLAGCVVTLVLTGIPATALPGESFDANPTTYDGTAPLLTMNPAKFVTGASLDAAADPAKNPCGAFNMAIPLELRWSGSDAISGFGNVGTYELWHSPGDGAKGVFQSSPATSYRFNANNYYWDVGSCTNPSNDFYWVKASDMRGNEAKSLGVSASANVWQETGVSAEGRDEVLPPARTGTWSTSNCTCFNGGRTLYSTAAGAALTYTVRVPSYLTGTAVAVVMEKNTNRGQVNISVDGAAPTPVDTYASFPNHRVIVWQKQLGGGTHTIKISNAGTAGRSRVDVDSILTHWAN